MHIYHYPSYRVQCIQKEGFLLNRKSTLQTTVTPFMSNLGMSSA